MPQHFSLPAIFCFIFFFDKKLFLKSQKCSNFNKVGKYNKIRTNRGKSGILNLLIIVLTAGDGIKIFGKKGGGGNLLNCCGMGN